MSYDPYAHEFKHHSNERNTNTVNIKGNSIVTNSRDRLGVSKRKRNSNPLFVILLK